MIKYEEFISTFDKIQKDLEEFDLWFKDILRKGINAYERRYDQELGVFLKGNKLFLDDDNQPKVVRFKSQAEFALGLILEYLLKITDYQSQTFIIFRPYDFFIPRLHLIIEVDGKNHYADWNITRKEWIINFSKINAVLQEYRQLQHSGFRSYRYLAEEIYLHTNNKDPPILDSKFLYTFIYDIINLLQNDDSLEDIKLIRDYAVKLEAEKSKK